MHNLIRGCDPQPGSYADAEDGRIRLYEPSFEIRRSERGARHYRFDRRRGMKIALAGGTVTIKRARIEPDAKKVAPAELASSGAIREGMRLA